MMSALDMLAERGLWLAKAIIGLSLCVLAWYAGDRLPPVKVQGVYAAAAHPGQPLLITADIQRDASRRCMVDIARYITAADGARYELPSVTFTPQIITALEAAHPGQLQVELHLPEHITPGPAVLHADLQFRCNKVHNLWPISTQTQLPFTVLP